MRKKLVEVALLILALVAYAPPAGAQADAPTQTVLIDGSGSMKGFFYKDGGQGESWMDWLRQAITQEQPAAQTLYFVDQRLQAEQPGEGAFGQNTYIKDAFEAALNQSPRPDILWLVTDNQSSVGGRQQSDSDTARFYEHLRSDEVARVKIFPLQLPFTGRLDMRGAPLYTGIRGLLLYAILLNGDKFAEFEEAVAGVESRLNPEGQQFNFRGILVKPLDRDFLSYTIREGENFKVGVGEVVSRDFSIGEPIDGHFFVDLTSTRGEIEIEKASVAVEGEDSFGSGDFSESNVHPTVSPEVIENLGPQNTKPLKISLKVEPVSWRWWNPVSILKSMNDNRGFISGNLRLRVKVPPQNFKLVREVTDRFNAGPEIFDNPSPQYQQRIYKLNDLVLQSMIPAQGAVNIGPEAGGGEQQDIAVKIAVTYPPWPALLLLGVMLLPLLLLLALLLWVRRQPLYRLTWQHGKYLACPDFRLWPFVGRPVELDGRSAASIRKTLSGIRVSAGRGFAVDEAGSKIVNASGSDFSVSRRSDGAALTFYFSKVHLPRGRPGDASGDIPYGKRPDDGGLGNGRPPLQRPVTGGRMKGPEGPAGGGDGGHGLDSLPG